MNPPPTHTHTTHLAACAATAGSSTPSSLNSAGVKSGCRVKAAWLSSQSCASATTAPQQEVRAGDRPSWCSGAFTSGACKTYDMGGGGCIRYECAGVGIGVRWGGVRTYWATARGEGGGQAQLMQRGAHVRRLQREGGGCNKLKLSGWGMWLHLCPKRHHVPFSGQGQAVRLQQYHITNMQTLPPGTEQ